jgi:ADP-ribosylglycohydrolase
MRVTWVQPEDLIRHELYQSEQEGRQVKAIADQWVAAGGTLDRPYAGASQPAAAPALRELAGRLLDELDALAIPDHPDEPDAVAEIFERAAAVPALPDSDQGLADRIHGGWLGRAAGCLLGKPVEKIPRHGIREILDSTGRWPLTGYFTAEGLPAEVAERWPWNRASRSTSLAEVIDGMPEDDDLNYTILALSLVERHGAGFGTGDVAAEWLSTLPAGRVFTAERAVYANLLQGIDPAMAARRRNPYREWIGAQIRGDLYGWIRPGDPRAAAELAWRDARLSHTRNGVYGAMFVAAMASAAVVTDDVETVLDAGMSAVPVGSRLADAVALGRELGTGDVEHGVDVIADTYADLHWVHVLNNAALLALGLTAGGGDFSRTICLVVSGGWDTDSNGATAGAVTGAMAGAGRLPGRWIDPLRDRYATSMPGFDGVGFTDLAARTVAQADRR